MARLPRIIWFCWFQGLEQAPELVRECHASWVRHNPGWEVHVLDERNVGDFVDESCGWKWVHIPVQKRANLLRLVLLEAHGGVWADATCYCARPLEDWIFDCMDTGFFCFQNGGPRRVMASWFLAALPGNELVRSFRALHTAYWRENRFRDPEKWPVRIIRGVLKRVFMLRENWTDWWFSQPVKDCLRLSPYFAAAYHFAWHLRRDEVSARIFHNMPRKYAAPLLGPAHMGLKGESLDEMRNEILRTSCPLYKWNWKFELFGGKGASEALHYLFREEQLKA